MPALLLNRWVQLAAGTALALVFGFGLGHHQKTLEDASGALKSAKATVVAVKTQGDANSTVDQHASQANAASQQQTITLIRKVPVYVSRKADDQCVVSRGAVSLLDAAASDTVPAAPDGLPASDPPVGSADGDSGVKLSAIVQADIVNAGSYRLAVIKGSTWDDWYDAQNPDWKKAHPAPKP